jgi:hypothetical protein
MEVIICITRAHCAPITDPVAQDFFPATVALLLQAVTSFQAVYSLLFAPKASLVRSLSSMYVVGSLMV